MLAKMILQLLTMCCLVTTCSSLSSYSPTSAGANTAYMKQNQYITRVLLGKNKRPMPGSSATYKAEPMEWRQALHYLDQTLQGGFIPDMKTWTTVLRICQQSREALATMSVFDRMQKVGVQPDRFAYQIAISSCIYMESKTESWQKAVALLLECDRTLPLDGTGGSVEGKLAVSIFAAAISVCERAAQGRAALKLYDLMSQRKQLPRPDVVMISSIVAACEIDSDWAKLDDVLEGSGVVPDLILYHQLIRIAGKKFDPLAAFHHLRAAIRQGLQPTRGTYRELVEACQISVESIPRGAFLLEQAKLLLNRAYPGVVAENDNDSGSIRTGPKADFMLDGSKCTTTNGPGGDYEPSTRKMLKMLETTTPFRLHDTSALPESGHRISFQAAQELLAMHCEKQALAALLENAPVSTDSNGKIDNTIRLAVSLCMCADCHMVFKYASEGYNRRIECSDPSRTHCFEQGECSCLDNWPGKARAVISKQVHIGTFL